MTKWLLVIVTIMSVTASVSTPTLTTAEMTSPAASAEGDRAKAIDKAESKSKIQVELEKELMEKLSYVAFEGYFTMGEHKPDDKLKRDSYTIVKAEPFHESTWKFEVRIGHSDKGVTLPILLPVEWAGDTPVITVDAVGFPGMGKYSARVLIYEDHYAGYWKPAGKDTGGHLFGKLRKLTKKEREKLEKN